MKKCQEQQLLLPQRGTSLLELLGFLAVAALLIGGSLGLYQLSAQTARVDELHVALETTATRLKQYASGRDTADLPGTLGPVKPPNGWSRSGDSFVDSRDGCRINFVPNNALQVFAVGLLDCRDEALLDLVAKKKVAGSTGEREVTTGSKQVVWFRQIPW